MLTVLLGGARSGKSSLALDIARGAGAAVTFVATSPTIAGDDDLAARIGRHRAERPHDWTTIEEQLDLAGALARAATPVVIVDCLTTWVGNMLHHGVDDTDVIARSDAALEVIRDLDVTAIIVSNEVGLGIVPDNELARSYRDLLGRVNQAWVAASDTALMMIAGRALPLHPVHELRR